MSITFPEGAIVRKVGTVLLDAYVAVIVVALIWGPLIVLHGYRAWWLVTFYAVIAVATVGGIVSHYRFARRNGKSSPHHGPSPT